jgi:hypothetical protein
MINGIKYQPLINGQAYDWSNIVCTLLGNVAIGISKIDYEVKQDMTDNWGAGINPVSRGFGNRKATASITLYMEEMEALQTLIGGNVQDIPEFDILVQFYTNPLAPVTHTLKNCRFTNNFRKINQNDMNVSIECELIVSHILFL